MKKKYGMFFTLRVQGWLYLLRLTDFHRVPDASTYPRNNRRSGPLINPQKGQVYLYLCSNLKLTKKKYYKNSKTLPPVRWGSSTHLHWHSWQFGSPAPFLKWFRLCILVAPVSSALFFNVQRLNSLQEFLCSLVVIFAMFLDALASLRPMMEIQSGFWDCFN